MESSDNEDKSLWNITNGAMTVSIPLASARELDFSESKKSEIQADSLEAQLELVNDPSEAADIEKVN